MTQLSPTIVLLPVQSTTGMMAVYSKSASNYFFFLKTLNPLFKAFFTPDSSSLGSPFSEETFLGPICGSVGTALEDPSGSWVVSI
jgi:hypothetical protein